MTRNMMLGCLAVALLGLPLAANASTVTVEATNNQPMGGFSLTPIWLGFHDGSFDAFDAGSAASAGVELIAELGDPSVLDGEFMAAAPSGVSDVLFSPSGPPPFTPGQSNSLMVDVGDATANRYFSFASMVIPSNDLFIGNDGATAYEVFDAAGNFNGPITIELYGYNIWDAGTEVNDVTDGPAFVVGQDATMGTAEGDVIRVFFDTAGAADYMATFDGVETPAYTITDTLHRDELLGTIVITPEPTSFVAFALTGLVLAARRRR